MDVRLPNGEVISNVPDDISKADLVAKLRANGHDLSWLDGPAETPAPPEITTPAPNAGANIATDLGNLVQRSAARLGGGLTELPNAVGRLPGEIAGNAVAAVAGDTGETQDQIDEEETPRPSRGNGWFGIEATRPDWNPRTGKIMTDAELQTAQNAWDARYNRVASGQGKKLTAGEIGGNLSGAALAPVTESRPIVATREWLKQKEDNAVAALSPKVQRALELPLVESDEEGLHVGEGAKDPWWWTANVIDVGAQAAPTMLTDGMAARFAYAGRYRQALESIASQEVPQSVALRYASREAMKAAKRAAVISGGLTEGAVGAGEDAQQTQDAINSLDEKTLMNYPGYVELRDQGMTHEQARAVIARDKAASVAISAGSVIGLTGAPMNAWFGKLTANLGRVERVGAANRLRELAKGAGGEAAQEFVQEGSEQYIQNKEEQPITGKDTWDGVLENAITGAALGGVIGGAEGGLFHKAAKPGEKKPTDEGTDKTPAPENIPATPSALEAAKQAYDQANENVKRAEMAARDPSTHITYADLQAARDEHKQAMVNLTRELLHSGNIPEADQATVSDALKQAEAAGVSVNTTKPATAGNTSPKRDAALEAVANAQQLDEADANDLISNGLAKVNPRGVVFLTPEGRRQRKAAQDRAAAAETGTETGTNQVTEGTNPSENQAVEPAQQPAKSSQKRKEKLRLPADRRDIAMQREAQRAERAQRPAKELAAERAAEAADKAVTPESIAGRANELAAGEAAQAAAGGKTMANPQLREAFAAAADRMQRARAGLPTQERTSRTAFRLKGQPETVEIPGHGKVTTEPVEVAKRAAQQYREKAGITTPEQTEFARVNPERAKRIAQAFEEMPHEPNNPTVKRAYKAMIDETKAQWDEIKKTGLKVEFIKPGQKDPYAKSPRMAIEDVRKNNHLWVFPTDSGFGSDDKYAKDNPMLEDAGETVDGHRLKNNDVFRIVHDYFGHVQEANGFRADGEENAWRIHASMYSPLARRAMTTETRGQNSWVNYGPHGEKNRKASAGDTVYAPQKIGLLPHEFSAFPGETLKFKHFSNESADRLTLNPEKMGTGAKGAEAKRNGPKVTSLYHEHGEVEPDVANGRTRYDVEIPKADLYDASRDPEGFYEKAKVPFGMTTDNEGRPVPIGHRFDMNKFEEMVRDAGYTGYHTPEAEGILKGQARVFHPYPATKYVAPEERARTAMRQKKAGREEVERHLTPQERERLREASAKRVVEIFNELPSGSELASSALGGVAKRGWYRKSAEALSNVFGPDAPRVAALIAALSPQTSVEWNLRNAMSMWVAWTKAGRPTDRKKIVFLLRNSLFPNTNRVGKANVLGAWVNNTVRALTAEDPSNVTLSGPKVDSFAANLRGETERVTLDAWMANWAGVDQALFKGGMTKDETNPGMRPGYLAFAARVREAAKILTERTGETWTPAEVQETVWSWAKALYENADSYGALATTREILDNGELTNDLVNATPDFAGLFKDPAVSSILAGTVYGERAGRATETSDVARAGGEAAPAAREDQSNLRKAADRLEALRKKRRADEAATRAESAFATAPQYNWNRKYEDAFRERVNRETARPHQGVTGVFIAPMAAISPNQDVNSKTKIAEYRDRMDQGKPFPPIVVDSVGRIMDGHHRYFAALERGVKSIPVMEVYDFKDGPQLQALLPKESAMRTGAATRGIPREELQKVADRLRSELGTHIQIADSALDLPESVREDLPDGALPAGVYHEDPVTGEPSMWLVRENTDSADDAYSTALHETVGHMGLRGVLGADYHKVMEAVRKSFPEQVAAIARREGINTEHPDFATARRMQSLATEELIAYATEKVLAKRGALSQQSVWRRIIARVRDLLRNVGLLRNFNADDIESLIYKARDFMRRKPIASRVQELNYRAKVAAAIKQQAADAPHWQTPDEYLEADDYHNIGKNLTVENGKVVLRPGVKIRETVEDDLNPAPAPAPEREGEEPKKGPVKPDVVFPQNFDHVMRGNDPFQGQTTVEAYADGKNIGYVALSEDRVFDNGWKAEYVYVDPRYRGKGVAQAMYKAISDKLGVPALPSSTQTGLGKRMWDSFNKRGVAFKLKQQAQRQVDSPAFKAWFGDSKVTTSDGQPKILYHGTFGDFGAFSNESPESYWGPGHYASDSSEDASEYASLAHPDVQNKIDNELERQREEIPYQSAMMSAHDIEDPYERQEAYDDIEERLHASVRRRLGHKNEGSVMPLFARMENPLKVGGHNPTMFNFSDEEGAGADLLRALRQYDNGIEEIADDLVNMGEPGEEIDGTSVMALLRNQLLNAGALDRLPEILQHAGFDGIIDRDASTRWRSFTPAGANHYTVWHANQFKSAVGNNGEFSRSDSRVAFQFKQGPTGNKDLDSFISKIGAKPATLSERWQNFKQDFKDRAIMGLFDEFHGILRAGQAAGISAADSGYMDARLSKNAAELTQTIIEHGPPVWNDGAPDIGKGMGLLDILKPLGGNVNLWLTYMTALRANRLMGEGRENLFTKPEIDAALKLGEQHPEFEVARQQYNKLQRQVLDFAQESGIIDPQTRSLWEHADYIPFHRLIEGGEVKASARGGGGLGFVRNQIIKLKGGKQNIGDPLENIVRNWLALMDASLKANAARTTVDALNGTGLVTKAKTPSPIVPFATARQFLAANPQLAQTFKAIGLDVNNLPPQALAGLQKMVSTQGPKDETISVWRGGKREHWDVHDPVLMRSLQNIHSKAWAPIIRVLTYPKHLLTKGVTLTPQFALKNFWRDVWHVFVQGAKVSGAKITVLPTDSISGLVSALKNDATAKSLLAAGGSFTEGYVHASDTSGSAAGVRRSLKKAKTAGIPLNSITKVWRFYRGLQNAAENANRVAMYKKALGKGLSRKEAAFAARDLLDFSMRGNNPIAQLITMSTPFMNARLQGLYRLGRAFKEDWRSVAMRGMLLTLATAALLAKNYDNDRYKALTDQEKSNYWHFFNVFQPGDHFKLPKPFEVGSIFATIPEAIGDAMFTNSEDPDGTLQAAKYVGYTFGQTLNLAPQPQAIWPVAELAINQDTFTQAPILTQGDEGVLPEDQRGPQTSPTYAALAEAMPEIAPDALRSPKQLEHLGRGYLGNLQDYVLFVSDALVREARGEPAPPARATQDFPGIRDFYGSPGPARNNRHIIEMYKLADEAAKVTGSVRRNELEDTDEGDARADQLEQKYAPLLDVSKDFQNAAKQVTDLKKQQREVQLDPNMTPDEKRKEIDDIQQDINDIAKDVYDLRPGGKLNPETAGELIVAPPTARANILRNNNMPATAALLESFA